MPHRTSVIDAPFAADLSVMRTWTRARGGRVNEAGQGPEPTKVTMRGIRKRAVIFWIAWGTGIGAFATLRTTVPSVQGTPLDYAIGIAVAGSLFYHAWNWRCPSCGSYLG